MIRMDIYTNQSRWKFILGAFGVALLAITLIYSNYLANSLYKVEEKNKGIYISATEFMANTPNLDADMSLPDFIQGNFALPSIIESEDGDLIGNNWGEAKDQDQVFLQKKISEHGPPDFVEKLSGSKIYIFNSYLIQRIQFFPIVQALLVSLFIAIGYYLFHSARRAEQNRVWAGMAKETAHQLGTPISAILAWIEYLKEDENINQNHEEVLSELAKDVNRLELIADRFSKIGSEPELVRCNIYDQLDEIKSYMKRRSSSKIEFDFPENQEALYVGINEHLFGWVLENLIRNALDAMPGSGTISARVYQEEEHIALDIEDSGKGIAHSKFQTVFKPGYSTKKRGWGLGLSLAKRIIEDYHKGKIFVKYSKINEGTCFAIKLPKL